MHDRRTTRPSPHSPRSPRVVGAWCNAYNKREKVARVTTKQQQKKEGASFSNVIAWALPVFSAEF